MGRKPKFKAEKTTVVNGGLILRSNRMFVQLKSIGECDDNGKTVMSVGYGGKITADPDKPLATLILPLVFEMMRFAHWTTDEAAAADLKVLQETIADLEVKSPGEPSLASA